MGEYVGDTIEEEGGRGGERRTPLLATLQTSSSPSLTRIPFCAAASISLIGNNAVMV